MTFEEFWLDDYQDHTGRGCWQAGWNAAVADREERIRHFQDEIAKLEEMFVKSEGDYHATEERIRVLEAAIQQECSEKVSAIETAAALQSRIDRAKGLAEEAIRTGYYVGPRELLAALEEK